MEALLRCQVSHTVPKEPTTRTLHPCAISATYCSTHFQTGVGRLLQKHAQNLENKHYIITIFYLFIYFYCPTFLGTS